MTEREAANSGVELVETVCDRERVALIFNPASGSEDRETRRTALEELARRAGLSCDLAETDQDRGAAPLAQQAVADGMERVLVSGGDGSVTEAAGALAGTTVALAVIPGGTGNLLSLNMDLPADAEAAMQVALSGEARPMDVGRANGTVFLIMAGMGLDAAMIRDADREIKARLGVLAYFVAALRNLRRPPLRYSLTLDGRDLQRRAQTVLVANLGRITGGVELVPDADPEDGLLEVVLLRAQGLWDLARLTGRVLLGRLESDVLLEIHRARNIVIETGTPQPVQLDGNEAAPTTRLEVHVEPGALLLVRAPETTEAKNRRGAGAGAPTLPALTRVALPVLLGAGALVTRVLRARAFRGRRPAPGSLRGPLVLAGLAAAVLTWLCLKQARLGAKRAQPGADDRAETN